MKLAILADIHANLRALQAVTTHLEAWQPDMVVVAGDIVNRGPLPQACWTFVQNKQAQAGWQVLGGNHDAFVVEQAQPTAARRGPQFDFFQMAYWTYTQLKPQVSALATLPFSLDFATPGGLVLVAHASMQSKRDGIFTDTSDEDLRHKLKYETYKQENLRVFCAGHTHWPLIRWLDDTLVVNVGSVGLPFDGDVRPTYAQVVWHNQQWQAQIIRVDYDHQAALQDFTRPEFLQGCGPIAHLVQDELHRARPNLFQWTKKYEQAILAGQITMVDAVAEYLGKQTADG